MRRLRLGIWMLIGLIVNPWLMAGEGSNLGSLATHYSPPVVEGQVTLGGAPAVDARIATLAGQRTKSEPSGDFSLTLDASGIFRVAVSFGINVQVVLLEVFEGQTQTLNINLGAPCAVETWPSTDALSLMISCVNSNQPPAQP